MSSNATLGLWCVILAAVGALLFLGLPGLDPSITALAYVPGEGFPFSHAPVLRRFGSLVSWIVVAAAVILLAMLGWRLLRPRTARTPPVRVIVFLIATMVVGPGLLVNTVFKDNWGRPRPSHTVEFGGTSQYAPPLIIGDQCPRNCAFVSGDAAVGFWFVSLALAFPAWRRWLLPAGLGIGASFSLIRVAQGGHYLSDVFYAGLITIGTAVVLHELIVNRGPALTHWAAREYGLLRVGWREALGRNRA